MLPSGSRNVLPVLFKEALVVVLNHNKPAVLPLQGGLCGLSAGLHRQQPSHSHQKTGPPGWWAEWHLWTGNWPLDTHPKPPTLPPGTGQSILSDQPEHSGRGHCLNPAVQMSLPVPVSASCPPAPAPRRTQTAVGPPPHPLTSPPLCSHRLP